LRDWLQTHGGRCEHRTGGALLAMFAKFCPSFRFLGGGCCMGLLHGSMYPKFPTRSAAPTLR
ncbi:unnamed protein product, partial [Ectocarpus sp. 8 AP-2014]